MVVRRQRGQEAFYVYGGGEKRRSVWHWNPSRCLLCEEEKKHAVRIGSCKLDRVVSVSCSCSIRNASAKSSSQLPIVCVCFVFFLGGGGGGGCGI